jgi:predicted Zn finger-like uncharacterized protein
MFTVCPKCALTLVVTAADLRIAQGYVRCGRCLNVFNALARLSEERPSTTPPADAATIEGLTPAEDAAPAEKPAPVEDVASVEEAASLEEAAPIEEATPVEEAASVEEHGYEMPQEPVTSSFTGYDDTGEIEFELDPSILVTSVRAPAALEETGELEVQESQSAPVAVMPLHPAIAPSHPAALPPEPPAVAPESEAAAEARPECASDTSGPAAQSPRHAGPVSAGDEPQTNTELPGTDAAIELATQPPRAALAWKLGAGALAVLLLLQIANHYRDALASDPRVGRPLSTLYSALGVKLAPRWNIHAYDVRQLGASAAGAAAGQIVVRASVKNTASRAQPLPLLRVTLQDRFGNRIAARDVLPSDYLPSSVARTSLLAAGSRVDATMVFVDPGPQAVGFEIDACLRRQRGEVACAHGP